jgi:predicted ATPase/class 3 adenylate cyclase
VGVGPPSGTVTFLFTDIEGSTRLWEAAPEDMGVALVRHDAIVHAAVDAHHGFVFATGGDSFSVAFGRAGDAVRAAVAMQDAFGVEAWPAATPIRVRMAIHTGEAVERDGDYFGTAVNQTARLMAVGHGGQILVSAVTAGLLGPEVQLGDLGTHRLRDLSAPQHVFQVGEGRFQPLRSVDAVPTNLPVLVTELIGRSEERDRIVALLGTARLVTLTGVGGIGKTRLALAVAAEVAPSFPDGCWFAELAPASTEDEVARAVAAALGAPATNRVELCRYLADRHLLVVVDNCEHVLAAAARLAEAVLGACPDVVLVATSREPLAINGEVVRGVPSLATPDSDGTPADALSFAAVRLFVDRATAASDTFVLDDDNVAMVVAICRHLDGIPLALELAAARTRAMSVAEIARRLSERFRLVAGGRGSLERHRTLLGAVSWSHDLLSDDERRVFRRLAIFPASFDLDAAEAVAGDDAGDVDVVECVLRLVDRSLVVSDPVAGRYRLLETLRQYGADRLADAGETEQARRRHAAYYVGLAPALAHSPRRVGAEIDNLRAVGDWLTDQQRWAGLLTLARDLLPESLSLVAADARRWYRAALDHLDHLDVQTRVDALGELGEIETTIGPHTGEASWAVSIALADETGAQHSPYAWIAKTVALIYRADPLSARPAGERAIQVARERGDLLCSVLATGGLAQVLANLDDFDESGRLAQQALSEARAAGDLTALADAVVCAVSALVFTRSPPDWVAAHLILAEHPLDLGSVDPLVAGWLLVAAGVVELGFGRPDSATGPLVEAIRRADRAGGVNLMHQAVFALGVVAAEAGEGAFACELAGCADSHLGSFRIATPLQGWLEARLDLLLADLDPAERARATQRGAALDRRGLMRLLRQAGETLCVQPVSDRGVQPTR